MAEAGYNHVTSEQFHWSALGQQLNKHLQDLVDPAYLPKGFKDGTTVNLKKSKKNKKSLVLK
jgi:hypothetical protein